MKIYSLNFRKHIDNIDSKKVIMTRTVTREASKGANCVAEKVRFLKLDFNKKVVGTRLILNFSYIKHKPLQNMSYCLKCKKIQET